MALSITPARSPRLRRAPWLHVPETDQCRQATCVVSLGSIPPETRLRGQLACAELLGHIHCRVHLRAAYPLGSRPSVAACLHRAPLPLVAKIHLGAAKPPVVSHMRGHPACIVLLGPRLYAIPRSHMRGHLACIVLLGPRLYAIPR
ncbi:unnamed protein product, partial [Musa acuminata var. zebrina]